MFEVEQKYRVDQPHQLIEHLHDAAESSDTIEQHQDTYLNHPSRDFGETGEALRIRRVDGVAMVTYKGPKLPGPIKARQELEWRLDPGDATGSRWQELLTILDFRLVGIVTKSRIPFRMPGGIMVVVDEVETLGSFAEIELVIEDPSDVQSARQKIQSVADELKLRPENVESRSYLTQILQASKRVS